MQYFTALPWPLNQWLGLKAQLLNNTLAKELVNWPNAVMIDAKMPLTADLLAEDGFHPSAKGAALWAQLLVQETKLHWLIIPDQRFILAMF